MERPQTISSRQVQYLQVQRRKLGISDELYGEMKRSIGVKSTLDLTPHQMEELLKRMNGSILRGSRRNRTAVQGWKPLHSSARTSGMHHRPPEDREEMVRKIEAILSEFRLPWGYVDGMAKKMFGLDAFRFCDAEQTYKLLQALCVYQARRGKKEMTEEINIGDMAFYVKELRGDTCQCGKSKGSGKSFCYTCYKRLPSEMQRALYNRIGEGYEQAYERAVIHLDRVRHQYD